MYHYGDDKMDFLDAVLILRNRGAVEEAKRYLSPDIALAIKTVEEGLDDEIKKAKDCGYTKGYLAAEKEKDILVEKIYQKRKSVKQIH